MAIHRPDIYGDTLQWHYVYTADSSNDIEFTLVDEAVQLARSSGLTSGENKNMPIDANGVITTKVAGKFILQYHCSFSGAANDEFTMYWKINDSQKDNGSTKWTMKGGNIWAVSSQTIMELEEGDTIDLVIANNTDTSTIILEILNQTIFKIW